jgi:hypothetical protein
MEKTRDIDEKYYFPSKRRAVAGLVVFAAFTLLSFGLVFSGHGIGWMMLLIGLPGLAMYITKILPMREYLRLDEDGFTIKTLFHEMRAEWKDVEKFGQMKLEGSPAVGFDLHPDAPSGEAARKLMSYSGHYAYVLPSNYSMPARALVAVLKDHHARATGDDESE